MLYDSTVAGQIIQKFAWSYKLWDCQYNTSQMWTSLHFVVIVVVVLKKVFPAGFEFHGDQQSASKLC